MVKLTYIKTRASYKLTFIVQKNEIPAEFEVRKIHVAGSFNNWDLNANPMSPNKKGEYQATIEVTPGQDVQFRYLVNGVHWINDWDADAYTENALGSDNCVTQVPEPA